MNITPSFKAIAFGSLVVIGGYVICMFLAGALASAAAPRSAWLASALVAALFAASSGFVGASFAPGSRLFNGTLAGFVGGGILLAALAAIAPASVGFVFVAPLFAITLLAFVGALLAIYIWPRLRF